MLLIWGISMVGRISKVLGGVGASLAIVVAGAGSVTWLVSKNANVADGDIVQRGARSFTEPPQLSVASQAALQSLDSLSVDVKPKAKMMIAREQWIVKSTAKVEEFPLEKSRVPVLSCLQKDFPNNKAYEDCLGATPGCTRGQQEWLAKNAVLVHEGLFAYDGMMNLGTVTLANTSTSAQSISFKDIRWKAEFSPVSDAGFSIACTNYNDWSGGAAAGFANARDVVLPAGPGTAVFGGPSLYGEDLMRNVPAGMPAVFNLAAGETSNVQLSVKIPRPVGTVTGRVVATVSAADGEREIAVPLPLLDGEKLVYTSNPRPVLSVDGGTLCPADITSNKKYARPKICSIAQFKAENRLG